MLKNTISKIKSFYYLIKWKSCHTISCSNFLLFYFLPSKLNIFEYLLIWIFWMRFICKASIHLIRFQIQLSMLIFKENSLRWLGNRSYLVFRKTSFAMVYFNWFLVVRTSSQQLWRERVLFHFISSFQLPPPPNGEPFY